MHCYITVCTFWLQTGLFFFSNTITLTMQNDWLINHFSTIHCTCYIVILQILRGWSVRSHQSHWLRCSTVYINTLIGCSPRLMYVKGLQLKNFVFNDLTGISEPFSSPSSLLGVSSERGRHKDDDYKGAPRLSVSLLNNCLNVTNNPQRKFLYRSNWLFVFPY